LITVAVLGFLRVARPDLLALGQTTEVSKDGMP